MGLEGRVDVSYPVGGVVGLLVGGIMNTAVAKLGAVVISLGTLLVGLVMLTEKSIGDVIDLVTALLNRLMSKMNERALAWKETRRLLREEKVALIAQWEEQQAENAPEVDDDERQARIVQIAKEKALAAIGQEVKKEKAAEERQASIVASLKPQPANSEPAWIDGGLAETPKPYQAMVLSSAPTQVRPQEDPELLNPTLIDSVPPSPVPMDSNMVSGEEIRIVERDVEGEQDQVLAAEQECTAPAKYADYELPPLNLLDYDAPDLVPIDEQKLQSMAEKLERNLETLGIEGRVREVRPGPVVTTFEFVPAPGIKVSKIANLSDDIAMAMEAVHVRIVAPIQGRALSG